MRVKLTTRNLLLLSGLLAIGVAGSIAALGHIWQMRKSMAAAISRNTLEMLAAAELDIAFLKRQHETVSRALAGGETEQPFPPGSMEEVSRETLLRFGNSTSDPEEKKLLDDLGDIFRRYDKLQDRTLAFSRAGDLAQARALALGDLDAIYHESAAVSDTLLALNKKDILDALQQGDLELRRFQYVIAASIVFTALLGFLLISMLFRSVFGPLRELARGLPWLPRHGGRQPGFAHEDDLELLVDGLKLFVSEAAELRADLASSRHELNQSQRLAAIGNTVAQVAHEIKNRLIPLGGFALSLEKRPDDPEKVREKAHIISQEVRKLERLLRQINEFSKPVRLRFEVCSINALLEELIPKMRTDVAAGIDIKAALHPDPLPVRMDAERVEQVVVNLIRNAVEVLEPSGSGTVTVSTRPAGKQVAIQVSDDGPGMPPAVQEHIFEPFFTTKKHGTGLGLSISRTIMIEHGGDLSCASIPERGTTFSLTLPAA